MCLLSVIVPVYNKKERLAYCIESILNQSYKNIEIILVDDGSTDGSSVICDQYDRDYKCVKVIHKKNEGAVVARYKGAQFATGEYVGFVDADDIIDSEFYNTLMTYIRHGRYDIVSCGMRINEQIILDNFQEGEYEGEGLKNIYDKILFDKATRSMGIVCSLCTKLIRRQLFLAAVNIPDERIDYWEEISYLYNIYLNANSVYVTHYCGYRYIQTSESVSRSYDDMTFYRIVKSLRACLDIHQDNLLSKQIEAFLELTIYKECIRMSVMTTNYDDLVCRIEKNDVPYIVAESINERSGVLNYKEKLILKCMVDRHYKIIFLLGRIVTLCNIVKNVFMRNRKIVVNKE